MNIKSKIAAALALAVFVLPGITFAQSTSAASLQAQIAALLAEVQALQSQLTTQGGTTGPAAPVAATPSTAWCYTFTTNLTYGTTGAAVTALQTALQNDGESVTVTGTFDDQTAAAVTSFQEKYASAILAPYGLSNGTGYVGASTRAELNSLFGCGTQTSTTTSSSTLPIRVCPVWGCNGPTPAPTSTPIFTNSPSITVLSPNGGEKLIAGQGNTITWTSSDVKTVSISVCGIGGSGSAETCFPLNSASNNVDASLGSFIWNIDPNGQIPGYPNVTELGSNIKIRVTDNASGVYDESNNTFVIAPPGLVLSLDPQSPSGSQVAGLPNTEFMRIDLKNTYSQSITVNELDFAYDTANYANLSNIRLVDMGTGAVLQTLTSNLPQSSWWDSFQVPITIAPGATRVLSLRADMANANFTLSPKTEAIVADFVTGAPMVSGNSLTFTSPGSQVGSVLKTAQRSVLSSGTITPGSTFQLIGSYWVYAPSTEGVSFKTFSLNVGQNASIFQNLKLDVGAVQFGNTWATPGNNGVYTFNGNTVVLPAGSYTEVDVFADVLSNAQPGTSNTTTLVGCTATGATSQSAYSCNSVVGQTMTVAGGTTASGGTLTGAISAGTPQSTYVGMGTTGVTLAQYQFSADANGSEKLTQVNITDSSSASQVSASTDHTSFVNYRLVDASGNTLAAAVENASGVIQFNLSGLSVPANATEYLNLKADVNNYPYATSGATHAFALTSFNYANGVAANTQNVSTNNIGNLFTVYQTTLNATAGTFVNPTSISNVGAIVGSFIFTAGNANLNPLVKTVTLQTRGSVMQWNTVQNLGLYDAANPSVALATAAATGATNVTFNLQSGNSNWGIPAGASRTLLVKMLSAPAPLPTLSNGTPSNYEINLAGVTWSDGVTANIPSLSPNIAMPIAGQLITFSGSTSAVPTVTFSANPTTIGVNQSTTLSWSSTNATGCTISGDHGYNDNGPWSMGSLGASGSLAVIPYPSSPTAYSAQYQLTCTGPGGASNPASVTVNVNAPSTPAPSPAGGTVNIYLDPSTPAPGTVTAGSSNVTFAKMDISAANGGVILQSIQVVSAAGAVGNLSNIKVFDGSGALLGSAANLMTSSNMTGSYANISLSPWMTLSSGQIGELTLVADVASSASGSFALGIGGGGGNYGSWGPSTAVYGNTLTVSAPTPIVTPPIIIGRPIVPRTIVPLQSSATDSGNQTAIVSQSIQGLLDQLSALLKSL